MKHVTREGHLITAGAWIHELVFIEECLEAGLRRAWDQNPNSSSPGQVVRATLCAL
jgi:hypothetical protein